MSPQKHVQRPFVSRMSLLFAVAMVLSIVCGLFLYSVQAARALTTQAGIKQQTLAPKVPKGCKNDGQTDFPGAINCIVDAKVFDCEVVKANAPCTYESAQRPTDFPIDFLVIHNIEGPAAAGLATFRNVKSNTSIHYIVDVDGTIYQLLREHNVGYHAGNYWYNLRSIGIEHAGYAGDGYKWYNSRQYQASARLTAYLMKKYHLPLDHSRILSHGLIPAPSLALTPNHVDPGPYWLWDYYFSLIAEQGIPLPVTKASASVIKVRPPSSMRPWGPNGSQTAGNFNYFSLYNSPNTKSGLVPHASGDQTLDETSNIEPGVSYVYLAKMPDQAGTGLMMYQIWYGVESHLQDKKRSHLATARKAWLAVPATAVAQGSGKILRFRADIVGGIKVYGKPDARDAYKIGEAPVDAVFVAPFAFTQNNQRWYAINFNHRQAFVPATFVAI